MSQRNFFPAVITLALNTGLFKVLFTPWKGFMNAFTHASYTSVKNNRKASSVCGLVGLFGMFAAFPEEEDVVLRRREEGGAVVVKGANGGNINGLWAVDGVGGAVFGG